MSCSQPVEVETSSVSEARGRRALWSRVLRGGLVVVVIWALAYLGLSRLAQRGAASAVRSTTQIYLLASRNQYSEIAGKDLCGQWALNSLRLLDEKHGALQSYVVAGSGAQLLGRPSWVRVEVQRGGQSYVDDVSLMDSVHPVDIVEYPKADYDAGRFDRGLRADKGPGAVNNAD